ncbi:MAG: hypothetical protein N2318_12730 [Meiothermus sp.]|uniref:hypothetical protein n=1 Tax=Meiothermus sp. TaxID=1955249 RepID=UPI00298F381A|nr:hypothetical protein [Meiothermus sp.]MCX7784493.1 hypothetical protein [Meiothermus sp.]MDW8482286.1 hypothetical protein [Meiothermus sp.]MDW8482674.1 hypothetical protein [Meiothermus sp.]
MMVVLPQKLEKKISQLKKIQGKGWDKKLEKAIDALLAENQAKAEIAKPVKNPLNKEEIDELVHSVRRKAKR